MTMLPFLLLLLTLVHILSSTVSAFSVGKSNVHHRFHQSLPTQSSLSNDGSIFGVSISSADNTVSHKTALYAVTPTPEAVELKNSLLASIQDLRTKQARDGEISVDFGVKDGELNATTRAPQKLDFYSISNDVGEAADKVLDLCDRLGAVSPVDNPTRFLGNRQNSTMAPLEGPWKLLFSTAADASFSKNSTRGDAKAQNIVNGVRGTITNVIDFANLANGAEPFLKQLRVVIGAKAVNAKRVELNFRYAKAVFTRFLFLKVRWSLWIPVPDVFITRCIVIVSTILRLGRGGFKAPPTPYFDVLYLDDELRIHKTGQGNIFVQAREWWDQAKPLLE